MMFGIKQKTAIEISLSDLAHLWLNEDKKSDGEPLPEYKNPKVRHFWESWVRPFTAKGHEAYLDESQVAAIREILKLIDDLPEAYARNQSNTEMNEIDIPRLTEHCILVAEELAAKFKSCPTHPAMYGAGIVVGLVHDLGPVIPVGDNRLGNKSNEKLIWWLDKRVKKVPLSASIIEVFHPYMEKRPDNPLIGALDQLHMAPEPMEKGEVPAEGMVEGACSEPRKEPSLPSLLEQIQQKPTENTCPSEPDWLDLSQRFQQMLLSKIQLNSFEAFIWQGQIYFSPDMARQLIGAIKDSSNEGIPMEQTKHILMFLLPAGTKVVNANYRLKFADHNRKPEKKYYFAIPAAALAHINEPETAPRDKEGRWLRSIETAKIIDEFSILGGINLSPNI